MSAEPKSAQATMNGGITVEALPPHPPTPTRWIIATQDEGAEIIEVRDLMECILEPGDCGWVSPVNPAENLGLPSVVAHFENLFPTRAAAIGAWVSKLRREIASRTVELDRWMADPEAPKDAPSAEPPGN